MIKTGSGFENFDSADRFAVYDRGLGPIGGGLDRERWLRIRAKSRRKAEVESNEESCNQTDFSGALFAEGHIQNLFGCLSGNLNYFSARRRLGFESSC